MRNPPRIGLLLLFVLMLGVGGCFYSNKPGFFFRLPTPLPASPLPAPLPTVPVPPDPAPDDTLYAPRFEDPALVPAWAQPLAPEGTFNTQFSPDGAWFVYIANHPGTRRTSLYSVSLAGGDPVQLGTGGMDEEIFYFTITPDSQRVIYYLSDQSFGLYSTPIAVGKPVPLTMQRISEVQVSPDGEWVVYWGTGAEGKSVLMSVPVAGGVPVLLGHRLTQSGSYQITPDSRDVLYIAATEIGVDAPRELYRVPIAGGVPLQLSQPGQIGPGSRLLITPDSQFVIFGNLYRVAINGNMSDGNMSDGGTPQQLNPTADAGQPEGQYSNSPQLSADGRWLLFLTGNGWEQPTELYSMALPDGPTVKLNGPVAEGEIIQSFRFAADGAHVFYWLGLRNDPYAGQTLSVPINGGPITTYPGWDGVSQSPDGQWLIYSRQVEGGGSDIYSAPVAGGTPVQLNTVLPPGSAVAWWMVTPDNQLVIYATSTDAGGGMPTMNGYYAVPIAGGEPFALTGVDGRDPLAGFSFLPDSERMVVDMDYDDDGSSARYIVDAQRVLSPP